MLVGNRSGWQKCSCKLGDLHEGSIFIGSSQNQSGGIKGGWAKISSFMGVFSWDVK
jgi:hypothetical protein